jgi:hypothetical protein
LSLNKTLLTVFKVTTLLERSSKLILVNTTVIVLIGAVNLRHIANALAFVLLDSCTSIPAYKAPKPKTETEVCIS